MNTIALYSHPDADTATVSAGLVALTPLYSGQHESWGLVSWSGTGLGFDV